MTIDAFHHVMIAIPKDAEPEARTFYGDALGLTEIPKPEALRRRGGVWYQLGSMQLHLGVDHDFRAARKAHVAFQVSGLSQLRSRLSTAGLTPIDDDELPGYRRFYLDDPFGNRLEFLEVNSS